MTTILTCVACGADVERPTSYSPPYCDTTECENGYLVQTFRENARPEGECLIWEGGWTRGPMPCIRLPRRTSDGKRDVRVRARAVAVFIATGTLPPSNHQFYLRCKNRQCVAPGHLYTKDRGSTRRSRGRAVRLPWAPIEEYLETHAPASPRDLVARMEAVNLARERGWMYLAQADSFCIDVLNKHPYEVYGEVYFDAA